MVKKGAFFWIFLLTFFVFSSAGAAPSKYKWETVKVDRVVNNEELFLFDGRVIRIIGIDGPDIFDPRKTDQCYSRPTFRRLKVLVENQEIKIKRDTTQKDEKGIFLRHVKIEGGVYLAEFMIRRGMARFAPDGLNPQFDRKFGAAEKDAIAEKVGIWGDCGIRKTQTHFQKYRRTQNFRQKFGQYLSNLSVGKVTRVISGRELEIENKIRVRLLGLEVPETADARRGFGCFARASKEHLEDLVLGRKVFLKRDREQIDDSRRLVRYVFWSQGGKKSRENLINLQMISDGFARNFWPGRDDFFKSEMQAAQSEVFQNPRGAWVSCFDELVNASQKTANPPPAPDADCPIKGNISGSKSNPVQTFHTPASGWYERLQPERCFANEEEAIWAGFRKIK